MNISQTPSGPLSQVISPRTTHASENAIKKEKSKKYINFKVVMIFSGVLQQTREEVAPRNEQPSQYP
jgi:hypothetical protein